MEIDYHTSAYCGDLAPHSGALGIDTVGDRILDYKNCLIQSGNSHVPKNGRNDGPRN